MIRLVGSRILPFACKALGGRERGFTSNIGEALRGGTVLVLDGIGISSILGDRVGVEAGI